MTLDKDTEMCYSISRNQNSNKALASLSRSNRSGF